MILNKSNCRITQPFSIDGGYVQLSDLEKETFYFPVFKFRNGRLDVSVLSERYGDITVNVLDEKEDVQFTDTVSDAHHLQKRYNLSDLYRGKYKVEVIVNNEKFYYDIEK